MSTIYLQSRRLRCTPARLVHWLTNTGKVPNHKIGAIHVEPGVISFVFDGQDDDGALIAERLRGLRFDEHRIDVWFECDQPPLPVATHFDQLSRLLQMEASASNPKQLTESSALADTSSRLTRMVVRRRTLTIGGKVSVTFGKRSSHQLLPWTTLRPGTPAVLTLHDQSGSQSRGVIGAVDENSVEIALPEKTRLTDGYYVIEAATSDFSQQRERRALRRVRGAMNNRLAELRDITLGTPPTFAPTSLGLSMNDTLDDDQQAAIRFALSANDVAVIHGPPGTGKTTVVAELIRHVVSRGERVLVCAPSNLAVDNVATRLRELGIALVRLGHPARVDEALHRVTLDGHASRHPLNKHLRDAQQRLSKTHDSLASIGGRERARAKTELGELRTEISDISSNVVDDILAKHPVHCATLTHVDYHTVGLEQYDWCIVDEAGQCTEPACWIPLVRARKVILAGDPSQLPATVVSREAAANGLGISLLQRLVDVHGDCVHYRLSTQYRMHSDIMAFSSAEFYDNALHAASFVCRHVLSDDSTITKTELTESAVTFVDTSGADYREEKEPDGESWLNPDESTLVGELVQQLLNHNVRPEQFLVIAPYAAQVRLLDEHLRTRGIRTATVDGCQGQESDVVVVSMVRSNVNNKIGFLADIQRMNVALTRARRKLIVIGDSSTISGNPFYDRFLDHVDAIGAYHTVWEYT